MISRRRFLAGACGASLAAPAALAQPRAKTWRVGFLTGISRPDVLEATVLGGFVQGMRELGYVEGKNLVLEWRFAEGKAERYPGFAQDLVGRKVDAIVVGNSSAAHAARNATGTIPIVLAASGDPVAAGFVASLARPGGNITGLSLNLSDVAPKNLELLKATLPRSSRIAVLWNPANPAARQMLKSMLSGAPALGVQATPVEARTLEEIDRGFASMAREQVEAVVVIGDGTFFEHRKRIVDAALRHRLPVLVQNREYVELGGLMSYGQSLREMFRRSATYVDRILKGAKPGDLPIEQPNVFELVINLKTARALGVTIPPAVLARADRVFE